MSGAVRNNDGDDVQRAIIWSKDVAVKCSIDSLLLGLDRCHNRDCKLKYIVAIRFSQERSEAVYTAVERELSSPQTDSVHWQAAIILAELIPEDPLRLWRLVQEYGKSNEGEKRQLIATVLLEHLIEECPALLSEAEELAKRDPRFAECLAIAWK